MTVVSPPPPLFLFGSPSPFLRSSSYAHTHTHTHHTTHNHPTDKHSTAWSYEVLAEECYLLAEEHSTALQLPPLFFPKISDLVLWVRMDGWMDGWIHVYIFKHFPSSLIPHPHPQIPTHT